MSLPYPSFSGILNLMHKHPHYYIAQRMMESSTSTTAFESSSSQPTAALALTSASRRHEQSPPATLYGELGSSFENPLYNPSAVSAYDTSIYSPQIVQFRKLKRSYENHKEPPRVLTSFRKLPLEIRLHIWREAFPPGRSVMLDNPWFCCSWYHGKQLEPFPVTLYINHESRQETLKYYHIISRRPRCKDTRCYCRKVFCLSPARDLPCISLNQYFGVHVDLSELFGHQNPWLTDMKSLSPEILKSISSLEIRLSNHFDFLRELTSGNRKHGTIKAISNILWSMGGLRQVSFVMCKRDSELLKVQQLKAEELMDHALGVLREIFAARESSGDGESPKITLLPHHEHGCMMWCDCDWVVGGDYPS